MGSGLAHRRVLGTGRHRLGRRRDRPAGQLREAYPTPPTATLRRIVGSGDLWAIEMLFDYDGDRFHVIVVHQWRDGLVERETSYYAAPFEAPAWRARWVEQAPSSASN